MHLGLSKLKRVPLRTLRSVLRSCVVHPGASTSELARACGMSEATTLKALLVLSELRLAKGDGCTWTCDAPLLTRSASDSELDSLFRASLLAYRPFECICEGLLAGETLDQAMRHAAVALRLDDRAQENMALLLRWGMELSLLGEGAQGTYLSPDLQGRVHSHAALPVGAITSSAEARLYVSTLLGRDAFDQLDETDRSLLVTGVVECDDSPANSVEASGQALEDYLRELCMAKGLGNEAVKLSGAGQLAGLLRQHNLIHAHHVKLVDLAATLRNAKAHRKDKQTVAPWSISSLGARTAFGAATLAIRSIHEWITRGGQCL